MWESFLMLRYWLLKRYLLNSILIFLVENHRWIRLRTIVPKDKYFYANPARLSGQSAKSLNQKKKKDS